jgi:addiction module HigA family antidote
MNRLLNIHPGEVLQEDFLTPLEKTGYWLAKQIGITPSAAGEILKGKRRVTAETALRLGRLFSTTPELWLNLQSMYDLEEARGRMSEALADIQPCIEPAADIPDDVIEPQGPAADYPLPALPTQKLMSYAMERPAGGIAVGLRWDRGWNEAAEERADPEDLAVAA